MGLAAETWCRVQTLTSPMIPSPAADADTGAAEGRLASIKQAAIINVARAPESNESAQDTRRHHCA